MLFCPSTRLQFTPSVWCITLSYQVAVFLFKKIILTFQAVTLAVVSFGVAVATVTDLEFNFFGACVALAWIVPSAVNKILWSSLQQSGNWTALAYVLFFLSLIQIIHNFIPLLTQIIHY
jgi:hypothetical protein